MNVTTFKTKQNPTPHNPNLVIEALTWYMENVVGNPTTYNCVRNNAPWWDRENKTGMNINWKDIDNWKVPKVSGKDIGLKGKTNKENYFARKYIDHVQPGNLLTIVDTVFNMVQQHNLKMRQVDSNLLKDIETVFQGKPNTISIPKHIDLPNSENCYVKWQAMMLLLDTVDRIQFKAIAEKYSNKILTTI